MFCRSLWQQKPGACAELIDRCRMLLLFSNSKYFLWVYWSLHVMLYSLLKFHSLRVFNCFSSIFLTLSILWNKLWISLRWISAYLLWNLFCFFWHEFANEILAWICKWKQTFETEILLEKTGKELPFFKKNSRKDILAIPL